MSARKLRELIKKGAIKDAIVASIQGINQVTHVTPAQLRKAVYTAVKTTGEFGGDVAGAAKTAVDAAIEVGLESGMKAEEAATIAAEAAVDAAENISQTLAEAVDKAVSGTFSGVRTLLKLPYGRPVVMTVSASRGMDILKPRLEHEGLRVLGAGNIDEMIRGIGTARRIDIALIDVAGFGQDIWKHLDRLRQVRIPFLIITPQRSPSIQRSSISSGAAGLFSMDLNTSELIEYIRMVIGDWNAQKSYR